ncbi:EAL domain, c-di-GMP-specific phosphodiesterase class I (or its enzymatically inactive variant) [Marinobacter daqiaonensis]|uniref:EAL domain, c-di-GMP-specific phosphodiesterase class I (Or its enzymatically inactive variant) n=1 Tax=Marinobacter daqiaonensis TaxID=650891 RepID=A0A1I6HEC1_9GAMM|nr:EAL domain-containing protein [Marinobacter daqiaonensis]SFR52731.1 EAL domain, c-di-GMP-specific phosphodiesterase class I (or its enzymatically inactive variant) [Marinobacter daqiaonensis]
MTYLSDPLTGADLELLDPLLTRQENQWTGMFHGLVLKTALQPIFSISHKRIIGYEALVRAYDPDNAGVPPAQLFRLPETDQENILLDRLCRLLHIRNYSTFSDQVNWLFLNVSPRVVASAYRYDSFFGELLRRTGLPPHRIVVEIVEQPTDDSERLRETVEYYRQLGCLTAIDDFGAGHSNFERIWNLSPDIVKLDRTLALRASNDPKARQILNGIVTLLHQSGCLVLLEGVETHDQAMIAIDAGVDFVQGFYFSFPRVELEQIQAPDFEGLLADYKNRNRIRLDPTQQLAEFFTSHFRRAIARLQEGASLGEACKDILAHHTVSRCYLIDQRGVQIDDTMVSEAVARTLDPRYRPLENTSSADWYRQHYLKQALAQPNRMQVTTPYLSISGVYMCVTLSLGFRYQGQLRVLCCDILADQGPLAG